MEEKDDAVKQSANKDIKIKSLMKTNLELQSQLASLNQLVAVKDDLADQLNQVNDYVDELCAQKVSMQKELDTAGDYLLDQEEKTDKGRIKDQLNNMMISFCVNSNKANTGVVARLKQDLDAAKQRIRELEGQMKVKNDVQGIENVDENEEAKKDDRSILDTDADLGKV